MSLIYRVITHAPLAALIALLGACGGGEPNRAPKGLIDSPPAAPVVPAGSASPPPAQFQRIMNGDGEVIPLAARVEDAEGDAFTVRWRAVPLDDAGNAIGPSVEIGAGLRADWDLGMRSLASWFDLGLCQRKRGQRIRIELHALDLPGAEAEPYTAMREVTVACRPS